MIYTETRDGLLLSTDPELLDVNVIHRFIAEESYWAPGVPREVVERAITHSLCFAVYNDGAQIAFARIVTDHATFAYLADVFVLPQHRGAGIAKWMMEAIIRHPELQGLRRWMLMTAGAHGLYAQYGFAPLKRPERAMERFAPDVYQRAP